MVDLARTHVEPIPKPERRKKARPASLAPWRNAVTTRQGLRCRACGHRGPHDGSHLDAHHLIFRSHARAYREDPRNGLVLCNQWGKGCHQAVHEGRLKVRRRWLPRDVLECLREQGFEWNEAGEPTGPCASYFAKETPRGARH